MATDERPKQLAADTVKETGMALLVATTLHQPAPSGYSRDQGLLTTPLPNNERNQFRWNGPAFGIGSNSAGIGKGSIGGGQEFDPGCWVAP